MLVHSTCWFRYTRFHSLEFHPFQIFVEKQSPCPDTLCNNTLYKAMHWNFLYWERTGTKGKEKQIKKFMKTYGKRTHHVQEELMEEEKMEACNAV